MGGKSSQIPSKVYRQELREFNNNNKNKLILTGAKVDFPNQPE